MQRRRGHTVDKDTGVATPGRSTFGIWLVLLIIAGIVAAVWVNW